MIKVENEKNAKRSNSRYEIKSNAKEILNKYYREEYHNSTLSDMYEDIANYCGISPSTVGQIRLKNLQPSYVVSVKLAELLNVKTTDIWEVVENKTYDRPSCKVFGCKRVATTRGYCMKHVYMTKNDLESERGN